MWQLPSARCLSAAEFEAAQRQASEGGEAEELTADAVEAEEEEQGARSGSEGATNGGSNGGTGGNGRRRKGPTLKERLERCRRTERERLTFGKARADPFPRMSTQLLATLCRYKSLQCWPNKIG